MRKIISVLLCLLCIFTFSACGSKKEEIVGKLETHAIIYHLDGGINNEENPDVFEEGSENIQLKEPSKYGYIFNGWYTSNSFDGSAVSTISSANASDINVYAKWTLNSEYVANLPLIEINTQDGVLPTDKENYINCSFSLSNCEDDADNFTVEMKGEYGEDDSVGIRLRGNSTMGGAKKPYRIKFDKKKSLFGLEKNKSWVLLADYYDQSSIRNYTAFSLGNYFDNLDFTPTPNHVVLVINNQWKGLYLLCEQVDEKEGRTDVESDIDTSIDEDFPFLIEMDEQAFREGVTGVDNFQINGLWPIEIKYPEYEDRGIANGEEDKVFEYIKDYMTAVYSTLASDEATYFKGVEVTFEDLVDVDSFIDYHLLNEVMYNGDSSWKSSYMHKTKNGKLEFGPVWDFDMAFNDEFVVKSYKSYIECAKELLIAKQTTMFNLYLSKEQNYNKVKNRWNELSSEINIITETLRVYKDKIDDIAYLDALLWYGDSGGFWFDMQYDYVRLFLYDRINFLDNAFQLNCSEFCNLLK